MEPVEMTSIILVASPSHERAGAELLVDTRNGEIEIFAIAFWSAVSILNLRFNGHISVLLIKFCNCKLHWKTNRRWQD